MIRLLALALIGLLAADALGLMRLNAWQAPIAWLPALAGGALFGIGALSNGACAFGTVGRIASGEFSFLATILGFVLGAVVARALVPNLDQTAPMAFVITGWALIALVAAGLAAFALLALALGVADWRGLLGRLRRQPA